MDDWKVGDEAICVKNGAWNKIAYFLFLPVWKPTPGGPQKGRKYIVTDTYYLNGDGLYLGFQEWPEEIWFAESFRKPDKLEACDNSFAKRIKRNFVREDA